MRIYHKLHKNPCQSKRAKLIRNISKRVTKMVRRNPSWKPAKTSGFRSRGESPRSIFEEIFSYKQALEDFHGLEVVVVGKAQLPGGGVGYTVEHPWFPPNEKNRKKQIDVGVCGPKKAREIGAVSVTKLATIGRLKKPSFAEVREPEEWEEVDDEIEEGEEGEEKKIEKVKVKEGILIEEVESFCCLAEKPELRRGRSYEPGVLLCTGKQRHEEVRIGVGKRPEDVLRDLHREMEGLTTQELALIDVELGGGRKRPGRVSKAKQAYIESDPLSLEGPELEKEFRSLQSRLSDIQTRKRKLEKEIETSERIRPKPASGTSLSIGRRKRRKKMGGEGDSRTRAEIAAEEEKLRSDREKYGYRPTRLVSAGALEFRYGKEEAERLAAQEREFKEEYLMATGGKLRRLGKGKAIPLNERFLIEDTPLIGVIWDEVALDSLTGKTMGKKGRFTWSVYDGVGNILDSGTVKRGKSGAGKSTAARDLKGAVRKAMGGASSGDREIRGAEAATIQEALLTGRPPPPLTLGEHLLVRFIPRDKIRVTKDVVKRSGTELKDIMRWGFPTTFGLVEFSRSRDGYHVTMKKPSGEKITASILFKNMEKAVEYAMVMMSELTGIKKWLIEEGPGWSGAGSDGRTRQRVRNPRGKLRLKRNPDLFESMKDILAPPFITRPKRKRASISATAVPKVGHHFRDIAKSLYGKEGFDFGFTFGVLRGIDTCGIKDVAERRRIRRYIEQQVIDAVYSLAVEAPSRREGNPGRKKAPKKTIRWASGWDPKKNPDPIEALKDIVAPPFITRAKRKRESISVPELPDLKQHFIELAWSLNGQAAYDFGFVFGVLRGIDTCGLMNVGERRRIRRRIEQELMDAAYGLSVEAPGSREE